MKQIQLKIYPSGIVQAETKGIKGKACLNYISIIEQLTGAVTEDSEFTPEYYEAPEMLVSEMNIDEIAEVEVKA